MPSFNSSMKTFFYIRCYIFLSWVTGGYMENLVDVSVNMTVDGCSGHGEAHRWWWWWPRRGVASPHGPHCRPTYPQACGLWGAVTQEGLAASCLSVVVELLLKCPNPTAHFTTICWFVDLGVTVDRYPVELSSQLSGPNVPIVRPFEFVDSALCRVSRCRPTSSSLSSPCSEVPSLTEITAPGGLRTSLLRRARRSKVPIVLERSAIPFRNLYDPGAFGHVFPSRRPTWKLPLEDDTGPRHPNLGSILGSTPVSSPLSSRLADSDRLDLEFVFMNFPSKGFFFLTGYDAEGKRGTISALLRPQGSNTPLPDVPAQRPRVDPVEFRPAKRAWTRFNLQLFGSSFLERPRAREVARQPVPWKPFLL